ncbi:sugar transferase [Natronoarchaeum sp. GCM10025703]|uniref:sugar transferase n=1 Tax=Natronoarchaeum sp. GCM10025703 TaxID=3252685 RepID=UPI0036103C56
MLTGWPYRITSAIGTVILTLTAVLVANHPVPQRLFTEYVPLFNRLEPIVLWGSSLALVVGLTVGAVTLALIPLYKPRPRRVLDTVALTEKRLVASGLALAAIGFFNFSYRVPRATLVMTVGLLGLALPLWFVWIRHRPDTDGSRTIVVGDDPAQIERVVPDLDGNVLGYLCPTSVLEPISKDDLFDSRDGEEVPVVTDGGMIYLERLGGLSRLEDTLVECDIDTVILAFRQPDRAEFFGALDACHEHGVNVKVHRDYTDSVLVGEGAVGDLVDVDLEPWDPQDHLFKRVFDVFFASAALLATLPAIIVISTAIKLEDGGSILYGQQRTATFGETFQIYKFRSMIENAESVSGAKISEEDAGGVDPRVTRVGRVLRKTHLDEIPQLWSILIGDMSVVGPRPERPKLDSDIQEGGVDWEKRWFIKPGLTGLAQINEVTGHEPGRKLRYDIEYVRKQSFWFDVKIVVRQLWMVAMDAMAFRTRCGTTK